MMKYWVLQAALVGGLMVAPMAVQAQSKPAQSAAAMPVSQELLTSTVHEAWVESGRNEDKFFQMVQACANLSAQKRGLTLPDTEAAGRKMGMLIKTASRRDSDQLLYAVVDAAVRQTATPTTAANTK
ncbi:hypothetical protein [Terriglobus roseus]|uniref:Uncharacterized protein n=1 Tax=Terriglobus roseus TaxID=392734 RepID=A0A1G7QTI7_9BACT|nr:hypothetical protein [Terriglobus roseus]SDG01838.1 hypothetical protein SAMN05444167_3997 [Terriglobus roseus]